MNELGLKDASKGSPYMFFYKLLSSKGLKHAFELFKCKYPEYEGHPEYLSYDNVNLCVIIHEEDINNEGIRISDHIKINFDDDFLIPILLRERFVYFDFLDERLDSYSGSKAKTNRILLLKEIDSKIIKCYNYVINLKKIESFKSKIIDEILIHRNDLEARLNEIENGPSKQTKYNLILEEASKVIFIDVNERKNFLKIFNTKIIENPNNYVFYDYQLKQVTFLFYLLELNSIRKIPHVKIVSLNCFIGKQKNTPININDYDSALSTSKKGKFNEKESIIKIFKRLDLINFS